MRQHHFSSRGLNGSITLGVSSHWHFSFSLDQIQNATRRSLGVNLWKDLVWWCSTSLNCARLSFSQLSQIWFSQVTPHVHVMQLANMSQIYRFPLQKKLFTRSWWSLFFCLFVFEWPDSSLDRLELALQTRLASKSAHLWILSLLMTAIYCLPKHFTGNYSISIFCYHKSSS